MTCIKEEGGKCPNCGGPAWGKDLRMGMFVSGFTALGLGLIIFSNREIYFTSGFPVPQNIGLLLILMIFLTLSILVILLLILISRRMFLHRSFIMGHPQSKIHSPENAMR